MFHYKGHLLLQSLRDNIIYHSQAADPNWYAVRELIGQYLFTMQEFYSSTNWVEMFGDKVCQELGNLKESKHFRKELIARIFCLKSLLLIWMNIQK